MTIPLASLAAQVVAVGKIVGEAPKGQEQGTKTGEINKVKSKWFLDD